MFKYVVIVLAGIAGLKLYLDYYPSWKVDQEVSRAVEEANAVLPKVFNNVVRLEKFRYDKKVVYAVGTILDSVPVNDDHKPLLEANLKELYCRGDWKAFAKAKVSVEYTIKFESVFYRGIEWVFKETPELCGR
ncbi:MAG TPA: hypothetical protein VIU46_03445 [Gallionellaceae bacterium]